MRVRISFMESVSGIRKTLSVRKLNRVLSAKARGPRREALEDMRGMRRHRAAHAHRTVLLRRHPSERALRQVRRIGKSSEKICSKCDGEGRVLEREIGVDIPAGIADGQTVRLRSQGEAGRRGASAGDLYVRIDVETDTRFVREGADIHSSAKITVLQAILGDDISVDTVHGKIKLAIPAGTQSQQVMRLKGKGMPMLQGARHGRSLRHNRRRNSRKTFPRGAQHSGRVEAGGFPLKLRVSVVLAPPQPWRHPRAQWSGRRSGLRSILCRDWIR